MVRRKIMDRSVCVNESDRYTYGYEYVSNDCRWYVCVCTSIACIGRKYTSPYSCNTFKTFWWTHNNSEDIFCTTTRWISNTLPVLRTYHKFAVTSTCKRLSIRIIFLILIWCEQMFRMVNCWILLRRKCSNNFGMQKMLFASMYCTCVSCNGPFHPIRKFKKKNSTEYKSHIITDNEFDLMACRMIASHICQY